MKPADYMHKLMKENGDEFATSVASLSRMVIVLGMVETMQAPSGRVADTADAMRESIAHMAALLQEMGGFDGDQLRESVSTFLQLVLGDHSIH